MKTLTINEAIEWCLAQDIEFDELKKPKHLGKGFHNLRFNVPTSVNQLTWFCRYIEEKLHPRNRCLLWVTGWGIWESSENWHLYYRLRESYGDLRLIDEAPAHLFLNYETHDLASFLQIGVTSGWDMFLFPTQGYARVFVSHDGWLEFVTNDQAELNKIKAELDGIEEVRLD